MDGQEKHIGLKSRPDAMALFAKYGSRAVPRYTSYPTAPHFSENFDPECYKNWLASVEIDKPISLYIHIPFCWQICWYCGCNMKLVRRSEVISRYIDYVLQEIELLAGLMKPGIKIGALHLGGGTPTSMKPGELKQIMKTLRQRFDLSELKESAIETDPRTLSDTMIEEIKAQGFNRVSFGIQEFSQNVQEAINRVQSYELVKKVVKKIRHVGISNINFDLLYGLPHQTVDGLSDTLIKCASLQPNRISAFGYAHVPWMAKRQRLIDASALPGPQERRDQMALIETVLCDIGYEKIGMDHFSLPDDSLTTARLEGRLHRNFQGYTTDQCDTLVGVGATAIGKTPQGYVQNISDIKAYERSIAGGSLPVAKGLSLTNDDKQRAQIIEQLMCGEDVDLDKFSSTHTDFKHKFSQELEALAVFESEGLVSLNGARLSILSAGKPYQRLVAQVFDAYQNNRARHSVAV